MPDRHSPLRFVRVLDRKGNEERVYDESARIIQLTYIDREKKADELQLEVDNFDLRHLDSQLWKKGNLIEATWGYPGRMAPTRVCVITKALGFTTLKVVAHARSVLLNTKRRSRRWDGLTRSEVVRQIAEANGWSGDDLKIEDSGERYETISQAGMTDAQFLARLAHQQGWEFYVDFDGFHFHERVLGQRPARVYRYYTDPGAGDILDISIEQDGLRKPGRVRARGRDPETGEEVEHVADNETDADRDVLGTFFGGTGPGDGETSQAPEDSRPQLVRFRGADDDTRDASDLGDTQYIDPATGRKYTQTEARRLGAKGTVVIADDVNEEDVPVVGSQAKPGRAAQRARGRFRQASREAVKVRIDAVGDASQLAKTVVEIQGIGQRLSGNYYVSEVEHVVGSSGYAMKLKAIKDATGAYARRANGNGLPEAQPPETGGNENDLEAALDEAALQRYQGRDPETGAIDPTRIGYIDREGRFYNGSDVTAVQGRYVTRRTAKLAEAGELGTSSGESDE